MYGAATSSSGSKRQLGESPGSVGVEHAVVFLVGRIRVVAQPLHAHASSPTRRDAESTRLVVEHVTSFSARCGCARRDRACRCIRSAHRRPRRRATTRARSTARTCSTAPSSSLNSASSGVPGQFIDVDRQPAASRERHFDERDEQAAVGAIVVREELAVRVQRLHDREKCRETSRIVDIGRGRRPPAPYTCASADAAEAIAAVAEIDQQQHRVACDRVAAAASATRRASSTRRERGDDQRHRRSHCDLAPPSCHVVRIDIESLPTGMLMPSAGHSSIATARTVSYSAASSPGCPAAAIQLADSLTSRQRAIGAAAMLVIASPTAMRPDAGASINASGVRSPIAIASPA